MFLSTAVRQDESDDVSKLIQMTILLAISALNAINVWNNLNLINNGS